MLNPELKKDLDFEIEKSELSIREYLTSDYFRETLEMVFKVNRLNEEQKESVELEVILYILGMSNYENIVDAIKEECKIENNSTAQQLNDDVNKYILEKINVKAVEIKKGLEEVKRVELKTFKTEIGGGLDVENKVNSTVKNLLNENFDIKNPRDLVKNIITQKSQDSSADTKSSIIMKDVASTNIQEDTKLRDVYRERPDALDTVIKKEI